MTIIGRLGAKKVKMLIKSLFSLKMSNIVERKFMFSFISSLDYIMNLRTIKENKNSSGY